MKTAKKLFAAMFLFAALSLFMTMMSFADSIPTKVRAYPKQIRTVSINLSTAGDVIKNVKGTSMKLKVTRESYGSYDESDYTITFMPKKKGKLKITFDVYSKEGTKKSSHKIVVFSYPGSPFKSITYGGKNLFAYSENYKASGKLVVKMNSGYKLVQIEVGTYGANKVNKSNYSTTTRREMEYKTVKNKSKITLGKRGYYYLYDYKSNNSYSHTKNEEIDVPTYIRITYKDKYTKQKETSSFYIYKYVW